jgi:hypothetical protein
MSQPITLTARVRYRRATSHRTTGFCRFVRRGPAAGASESGASYGKDRTPQQSEALHLLLPPHVALAGLLRRTTRADPARLTDPVLACGSLVEPRTPTVLATREHSRRQPAVSSVGHAGYVHRRRVRRVLDSNDDRCQRPSSADRVRGPDDPTGTDQVGQRTEASMMDERRGVHSTRTGRLGSEREQR